MKPGVGDAASQSDSGETAITAVVGILLMAVAMICLGMVVPRAVSNLQSIRIAVATRSEIVRFDALMLLAAGSVAAAPQSETTTQQFRLYQADGLVLQAGSEIHHFPLLSLVSVKQISQPIPHVLVVVRDSAGEMTTIAAPLGHLPLATIPEASLSQ